jgi:hypothetical protein
MGFEKGGDIQINFVRRKILNLFFSNAPMATSKSPTCGRVKIPRRQGRVSVLIFRGKIHIFSFFILVFGFMLR